jgi:3',5'-cyclic AMP phosphodiesterase CpdA
VVLSLTSEPETSMAVNWRTSLEVKSTTGQIAVAEAGPDFVSKARAISGASHVLSAADAAARYHSVTFTDLAPDTKYVYRVGDGKRWSEWNHFKTASEELAPFSFIYYGDTQNNVLSMCARVMREAYAKCPVASFTLHAGDLVDTFNSDSQWGEWFDAAGWINRTVPALAVAGNHEYGQAKPDEPRRVTSHWNAIFELPTNGPEGMEELVYYVDYQGTRIVVLNSNEHHREQAAWLETVLRDNPCRWTIVSMHHPVYASFAKRNNVVVRDNWQPLFDKYEVDIVLQGHDHTYTRSGLMRHDASLESTAEAVQSPSGTVYVVSVAGPKMYKLESQPFMQRSGERTQLFQVITIDHDRLCFTAYDARGERFDAFTIHKRTGGPNEVIEKSGSHGHTH